jgi:DNA-binding winged helix-turn-helix (wHTH) protein/TolB-like protein/tetratricopeptide (TPR) repeat protein
MSNKINSLREFGKFKLDVEKKSLSVEGKPIDIPLKEIEVLCVLTESNELVTKEELLTRIWKDSFVEEGNVSRHIYRLRKMFADYGEAEFIQTVPRRGYRFNGEVTRSSEDSLIIERHSISRTLIEKLENSIEPNVKVLPLPAKRKLYLLPIAAILAIASVAFGFMFYQPKTAATQIKNLAVLPLKSFDSNSNDEQLRLQITDSLITKFGNLKDVSVRPSSAVFEFAKSEESSLEIGKRLQVDTVLDGRIQQEGDNLRINFQLINVSDGKQVWAEQFNGKTNQFLNLQDVICSKLVSKVSSFASKDAQIVFGKRSTDNVEAYENYLQGRYIWNQTNTERGIRLAEARKWYEKAVALDPNFAVAMAELSKIISMQSTGEYISRKEGLDLALMLAEKAYGIDPNLAETNTSLGLAFRNRSDTTTSERLYLRAIELNPNYTPPYSYLSFIYLFQEDYEKEIKVIEAGRKIDPTSAALAYEHVVAYQAANKCDKSLELLPEAIVIRGKNGGVDYGLEGLTYSVCGKYEQALPLLNKLLDEKEKENPSSSLLSHIGYTYAKLGNREKAREFAKMLEDRKDSMVYEKATPIYLALGDKEKTFNLLEEMTIKAPHRWTRLGYDLRLYPLKLESRFIALKEKMSKLNNF